MGLPDVSGESFGKKPEEPARVEGGITGKIGCMSSKIAVTAE